MSTANHYRPEPSPQDSGSVAPAGASGGSMGPETQMLNLKILRNLAQNNIYRDERSKEGVRALEKSLLGEGQLDGGPPHLAQYGVPRYCPEHSLLH